MDIVTLGIVKKMPGTAVSKSEAAAERAEQAAESAATRAQGIDITGTALVITEKEGD